MSNEFFKAKTILEPIEFWGNWWIPKKKQEIEKLPGILKFQTNSFGRLEICHNFNDTPLNIMESCPVLLGFTNRKYVSIFDAFVSNMVMFSPDRPITLGFSEYWEGNTFFYSRDDVKFKSVTFGINNLEKWHNTNSYDSSFSMKSRKINLTYKLPKKIKLFEDENVKIGLIYCAQGSGFDYGQTTASVKQSARIVIESRKGRLLPFYGEKKTFQYYIEMIFNFLSLVIGKNTFIYDIRGIRKYNKKKSKIPSEVYATRFWRQDVVDKHLQDVSIADIALPYCLIKDDMQEAIKQYNILHPEISLMVFELIDFQRRYYPIDHHILSQFIFLFEGIIRSIYKTEVKKYHEEKVLTDEYENMKKSILNVCKKNQKKWLNRVLTSYPKFREYYDVALIEMEKLFLYLFEERKDTSPSNLADIMFKYLKKERIKIAHSVRTSESDHQLYFHAIYWVYFVLIFSIWKKCGISIEIINTRIQKPYPIYNHTKKHICSLLPEWGRKN